MKKMKFGRILIGGISLSLLALISCSKESLVEQVGRASSEQTVSLELSFETAFGPEEVDGDTEARFIFRIHPNFTPNLQEDDNRVQWSTYDTNSLYFTARGPYITLGYAGGQDLAKLGKNIHFLLRRKGAPAGECIHFVTDLEQLSWTRYRLKRELEIPANPDPQTAQWYIMGFIGGEWKNGDIEFTTRSSENWHSFTSNMGGESTIGMPYVLPWTPLTIKKSGGGKYYVDKLTGHFRQQGSLCRMDIRNLTSSTIKVKSFKVTSNVLGFSGRYNATTMPLDGWSSSQIWVGKSQPTFAYTYTREYKANLRFGAYVPEDTYPKSIPAGKYLPYILFWGQAGSSLSGRNNTTVTLYSGENCTGTAYQVYSSQNTRLPSNTSYKLPASIK